MARHRERPVPPQDGEQVLLELDNDLLKRGVLYRVHAVFVNKLNAKGISDWARFKVV